MDRIDKCPYCGNDEEFYTKVYVYGSVRYFERFDGKEAENAEMYEGLRHRSGKYAYRSKCHKRIFKLGGDIDAKSN